ncbi:hypothetical protein PCE31106_00007 [Pandoraea cepalis]|uniref:Uncharacterized protein n=1 Tax=Pandoraea cepalis TaxID=2508294 RepID=A0A5E4RAX3_9BURK|nr:hypothetical protein PCE31106_00007 [Pandoraea cepalis]
MIDEIGGTQRQLCRLQSPGTVVECRGTHRRGLTGDDIAAVVGQLRAGVDRRIPRRLQRAIAVIERPGADLQVRLRTHLALVRNASRHERDSTIAADYAPLRTGGGRADRVRERTRDRDRQTIAIQGGDAARRIVQRIPREGQRSAALQGATIVCDGAAAQLHGACRDDFAAQVRQLARGPRNEHGLRRNLARHIGEPGRVERHALSARERAVIVDQRSRDLSRHLPRCARGRASEVQVAYAGYQRQVTVCGRFAAREIEPAAREHRVAARHAKAAHVELCRCRYRQVAAAADRTVAVHAGAQRTGRCQAARHDRQISLRRQRPVVRDDVRRAEARALFCVDRPAVGNAAHVDADVAAGVQLAGLHELSRTGKREVAGLRGDLARVRHTDALLRPHQHDAVGVHAAECADVDRDPRGGASAADGARRKRVVIDLVRAGDDVQRIAVDRGIGLHRTGDQIDLVNVARVQPRALNGNAATRHLKAAQPTVGIEDRCAGRKNAARGVDEAAAIDHDPRPVCHDDFGPAARDL